MYNRNKNNKNRRDRAKFNWRRSAEPRAASIGNINEKKRRNERKQRLELKYEINIA